MDDPTRETLRVAVIEDDPRYRHGLETLLANAPGFDLAGSFGSAEAALTAVREDASRSAEGPAWDLVLMDLQLPGMSGIEATREIKRIASRVQVLVLTVFEEAQTILEAICAGADGYLLKKTPAADLLAQCRVLASGGVPLTAGVARSVLDLLRREAPGDRRGPTAEGRPPSRLDLTRREQEVLQCLVRGLAYKQVAADLGISLDTVRAHVRAIYGKLQVHSVAEAVTRAIRDRMV